MTKIEPGMKVLALTAFGDWLPQRACTGWERGHTFPVIYVCSEEEWARAQRDGDDPESYAWPAADVKVATE